MIRIWQIAAVYWLKLLFMTIFSTFYDKVITNDESKLRFYLIHFFFSFFFYIFGDILVSYISNFFLIRE